MTIEQYVRAKAIRDRINNLGAEIEDLKLHKGSCVTKRDRDKFQEMINKREEEIFKLESMFDEI